jgi:hypothetical protein
MSLEKVKSEVAQFSAAQQDQLAAYLVHLRHQRDARVRKELSSKINDKNPDNWVSLGELKERWKD